MVAAFSKRTRPRRRSGAGWLPLVICSLSTPRTGRLSARHERHTTGGGSPPLLTHFGVGLRPHAVCFVWSSSTSCPPPPCVSGHCGSGGGVLVHVLSLVVGGTVTGLEQQVDTRMHTLPHGSTSISSGTGTHFSFLCWATYSDRQMHCGLHAFCLPPFGVSSLLFHDPAQTGIHFRVRTSPG